MMNFIFILLVNFLWTYPALAILDITYYEGKKLLLCSGHDCPNTGNNADCYTVDNQGSVSPDYIGDLMKDETYMYLGRKRFDLVFEEQCHDPVTKKIHQNVAHLLNPGGLFISRFCFPKEATYHQVKKAILNLGFQHVYLANLYKIHQYDPLADNMDLNKDTTHQDFAQTYPGLDPNLRLIYQFKSLSKEDIIKIFKEFALKPADFNDQEQDHLSLCRLPNRKDHGYQVNFLAVK